MNKILNSVKGSLTSILCAFLGAWGGAEGTSKNWRRFLIPFALSGLAYSHLRDWKCILIMVMMGAFSIGYGIPDPTDEGSTLGRFWYKITHQNVLLANIFTRATVGFMVGLSLIWIPIIKGNWLTYLLCFQAIKMTYAFIAWRDLGGYWVNKIWKCKNGHKKSYEEEVLCWKCGEEMVYKGKYLLMVDTIVYGMIGLATTIMIYF